MRTVPSHPKYFGNYPHQWPYLNVNFKRIRLQYDSEDVKCLTKITDCHKSSARHCQFNSSGTSNDDINLVLATCGEDKRLGFIDASGKIAHCIRKAHNNPINRVKFAND